MNNWIITALSRLQFDKQKHPLLRVYQIVQTKLPIKSHFHFDKLQINKMCKKMCTGASKNKITKVIKQTGKQFITHTCLKMEEYIKDN